MGDLFAPDLWVLAVPWCVGVFVIVRWFVRHRKI